MSSRIIVGIQPLHLGNDERLLRFILKNEAFGLRVPVWLVILSTFCLLLRAIWISRPFETLVIGPAAFQQTALKSLQDFAKVASELSELAETFINIQLHFVRLTLSNAFG